MHDGMGGREQLSTKIIKEFTEEEIVLLLPLLQTGRDCGFANSLFKVH